MWSMRSWASHIGAALVVGIVCAAQGLAAPPSKPPSQPSRQNRPSAPPSATPMPAPRPIPLIPKMPPSQNRLPAPPSATPMPSPKPIPLPHPPVIGVGEHGIYIPIGKGAVIPEAGPLGAGVTVIIPIPKP